MSEAVRLSSKLSKDEETNGLDHLAGSIKNNPEQVIAAIVWFVPLKGTIDYQSKTHEVTPTVQIKRVEPIGAVDKVPQAVIDLAAKLYEERTGKSSLPFDVVEVIEGGYKNPEPELVD